MKLITKNERTLQMNVNVLKMNLTECTLILRTY